MTLQRKLLRAMLWTLALAAAAGIATIFVSNKNFTGRVFATGLITAVAIALAMPVSKLLDRERTRQAGLAGLGTIVVTYLLSLASMWAGFGGGFLGIEEELGLSALATGVCGAAASILLGFYRSPAQRVASIAALVCIACGFALSMLSIWENTLGIDVSSNDCMETVGYLASVGMLGCACLIGTGVDKRHWRFAGVALALGALGMAMYSTWIKRGDDSRWFFECVIGAALIAHANIVFRIVLPPAHRWLSFGATGAMFVTAVCMSVVNFYTDGFDHPLDQEFVGRAAAAGGIVTGCATLAIIVLNRFNRRPALVDAGAISGINAVSLACPRCKTRQDAPIGASGCMKCGLILSVSVASPQCPACGYCTLDLTGDRCPECGGGLFPRGKVIPMRRADPLEPGVLRV